MIDRKQHCERVLRHWPDATYTFYERECTRSEVRPVSDSTFRRIRKQVQEEARRIWPKPKKGG